MPLLITGLVLFLGIHFIPAIPALRARFSGRLGAQRYKLLFAFVSAAGLALIVIGYMRSPAAERVFAPVPAAFAIAPLALTLSFILFAAANMRGYLRHTLKHPMLIGLGLWALVHLLANGDSRGTVLFGAFLGYALLDLLSAISRRAVKTFVPRVKYDVMAVIGGGAVAFGVMVLHRMFFGVPVVSFGV